MTPQQLRNSILQMAIEGKLTEQRAEDGNAADLLKEIKAEKAKMIAEKKIKKEKPLPEISEDEIPFEIPDNWVWCRLGNIVSKLTDGSHNPPVNSGSGYKVISAMNIKKGKIVLDNVTRFTDELGFKKENSRTQIKRGDIILGIIGGSIGNLAYYNYDEKVIAQRSIAIIDSLSDNYYIGNTLLSPFIQSIMKKSSGTAQGGIYLGTLKSLLIPLPPLAEQKRIVARLEEILPQVDEYEKAYNELQELNKKFPDNLKNSILQMAIEGKLVDQRAEEGNADDLLKEIKAEKAKLIKEKKIKKEKPLPEIREDEITFEIPDNWVWCRLGMIIYIARGGSPRPIKEYLTTDESGINWIKIGDTDKGGKYINSTNEKIIPEGMKKSRLVHKGDFLLSNSMSFGRPYILNIDGCIHDGWLVLSQFKTVFDKLYLYYLLSSAFIYNQFSKIVAGAVVNNLNSEKVSMTLIPLPPLAEQKRIVAKLEQLLPLCDTLKHCD